MLKKCINCDIEFKTYDLRQKFCNSSCSAKYNNARRRKKNDTADHGVCIRCGKRRSRNTTKFCSHECQVLLDRENKIRNGTYSAQTAKKYLLSLDNSCSICRLKSEWNNKPLMMILDHIDGNSDNNEMSNLRLVCPNCDSQLDTFKSRNRGNGRHFRKTRYHNGQSY